MRHGGHDITDDGLGGETLATTAGAALIPYQPLCENDLLLSGLIDWVVIFGRGGPASGRLIFGRPRTH